MLVRSQRFYPKDVMTHATLVATTIFAGAEDDRAAS